MTRPRTTTTGAPPRGARRPRAPRLARDAGTTLYLFPVGVLVVMVLAAVAVDLSLVQVGQRRALDLATAGANDAVTAGLDPEALRTGRRRLDPTRAYAAARRAVAAGDQEGRLRAVQVQLTPSGDVAVTVVLDTPRLFATVMPGEPDVARVEATATATAVER